MVFFFIYFTFVKEAIMFFSVIFSSIYNFEVTHKYMSYPCAITILQLS